MKFGAAFKQNGVVLYARYILQVDYVTVVATRKQAGIELGFKLFERSAEVYRFTFGVNIHVVHDYLYIAYA